MSGSMVRRQRVAIIGGGTMGGDIAVVFLAGGWAVQLMSPTRRTRDGLPERIAQGLARIGELPGSTAHVTVYGALDDIDWSAIDLVIEAVTEDLELKQDVMQRVEQRVAPGTPLASNTSNFSIERIAEVLQYKQRLFGMHFFMPAHLVPLVEIISSVHTDPTLAESMVALLKQLGKTAIWVKKDVPGFVGNRLQHAMLREALYLIEEGVATAEEIDVAVRFGFGFRFLACGPILQKEMSGWDTNQRAGAALYPHLHNETEFPPKFDQMVRQGHTGMKALQGVWKWTEESAADTKAQIERRLKAALTLLSAED